jgi:hypothetical protein
MRKNDGKPKLGHILHMPYAMAGLADVLERGEVKYTPVRERSWLHYEPEEVADSLMRHLQAVLRGEAIDAEGFKHVDAIVFNACVLNEILNVRSLTSRDPDSSEQTIPAD